MRREPRAIRSPAATLAALERVRAEFGGAAATRKLEAIAALDPARLGSARDVLRFHDALCFLRAYPDNARVLAAVTARLDAFERRPDFVRHRAALADTGVAGTTIHFRFFAAMASWLAARWPDRLGLDWSALEAAERIEHYLPLFAAAAEIPALDEYDVPLRDRLARMKRETEGDATLLTRGFERAFLTEALFEKVWDDLDLPLVLSPGPGTPSRTHAHLPRAPHAFQRTALDRARPELASELSRPPRSVRAAGPALAHRLLDLARAAMVTRARDLDAFSYADPRDVRIVDCGDGLAFACMGVRPERRLLLESVVAFLTLKNGVPIGYVLASALYGSAEIAYNVFETWRGAEAGRVYGRVLAMVKHLFDVDSFTINPYQLGDGNDEALDSGAWWFYFKFGFRPRAASAVTLMNQELARMKKNPRHRSPRGVLARLARESVYWHAGPARDDVIGLLPLANVGFHVTRLLTRRFGMDRAAAERECSRDAGALLGFEPSRGLTRDERGAWTNWAPLILTLPGVAKWSATEKRALVDVVLAKGGRRESEFVHRFDAHAPLRAAIQALAEDDASDG